LLHGSPTFFESLLRSYPQDLAGVRTGLVGGSVCSPAVLERLDGMDVNILNSYGTTEFGPATSCVKADPLSVRHASVGRPLPGFALRIVRGQVQVRSRHVTPGYFGHPDWTAEALDNGWFRTGDLGSIDQDGYLYIHGRAKDVIHVAGLKVFPAEVEGCLATHPDVLHAVVVGAPHDTMGEVPQAFVVPRPESCLSTTDLLQFARRHMAGYKIPYSIHLVSELPLLATGKPDRTALARSVAETPYADAGTRA
jgi:acyl-CoA synthetase (AMP-forming)/AMP-acid ligase II